MGNPSNQEASPETVAAEANREKALELRISGATYREIAKELGVSVGSAHAYVTDGLEELRNANAESTEKVRQMEIARLDAILVKLWPKREKPRVADTILRVSKRRSELLGLDVGKGDDAPPPQSAPVNIMPGAIHITLVSPTPEDVAKTKPSFVAPPPPPVDQG